MRKYVITFMMLISLSLVFSLDFVPGTHLETINPSREYSFGYHNGTDDFHWFGSSQWAVRYDFRAEYPSIGYSRFSLTGASVYFPVTGDSVTVELFTEAYGQPQQRIARVRTLIDQNNMTFSFSSIQTEIIWLVLTYNTAYQGPYVSASLGGGTHSYYLNNNVTTPYFQSMSDAGFHCEFLMSVTGDFMINSDDLELVDLELQGDLVPDSTVAPVFTIYNHSNITIANAQIEFTVTTPTGTDFTHQAVIPLAEPILPLSQYILDTNQELYLSQKFRLFNEPSQVKLRAVLTSSDAVTDTLFNNSIVKYYSIFRNTLPCLVAENFQRNTETLQIAGLQGYSGTPELHRLQYFPILSDSLSSIGAVTRYSWYSLFSTPVTIIDGKHRINGLTSDYQTNFSEILTPLQTKKTFISNGTCTLTLPTQGENLSIKIELTNESTHLFNSSTEPNLPGSSRLFVAFFKRTFFDGTPLYVFNRWIAYGDTINANLFYGQTSTKDYSTSLSNIDLNDLAQNYRLYYWIQKADAGEILYANYKDFSSQMAGDDPIAVPMVIRAYPNPLSGKELHLELSRSDIALAKLTIYNLRGQLIWSSGTIRKDQLDTISSLPAKLFPGNGIYLARLDYRDNRGSSGTQTIKISYIK